MEATAPKDPKRVFWHQFTTNHMPLFKRIRSTLAKKGFDLVLMFDEQNVCHDAYIVKSK